MESIEAVCLTIGCFISTVQPFDFLLIRTESYLKEMLPKLDYWKRYDELSDNGQFEEFKKKLINEINDLHIDGLPRVDKLNALVGKYVNMEYTESRCATCRTERNRCWVCSI